MNEKVTEIQEKVTFNWFEDFFELTFLENQLHQFSICPIVGFCNSIAKVLCPDMII